MGKRSSGQFERRKQDAYDTPHSAVIPLLRHLPPKTRFIEPCAGNGQLVTHLVDAGHVCVGAFDVKPRHENVHRGNAISFNANDHYFSSDMIITNPPWSRDLLHAIIFNLYWQRPTWLLFDADWKHTQQAAPFMPICSKIVSIGRVRWIEGSSNDGVDNAAWYLFEAPKEGPMFIGRK